MNNVSISGSGTIAGGTYNRVKISGSGVFSGDVEATEFRISGAGKIAGNAVVEFLKISGSGSVGGNLTGTSLQISGSGKVEGLVQSSQVKISGTFRSGDSVHAESIRCTGGMTTARDVIVDQFHCNGKCEIGEQLQANDITITLQSNSFIEHINGTNITVKQSVNSRLGLFNKLVSWAFDKPHAKLTASSIKGSTILLEYTEVETVRGEEVVIGAGTKVKEVLYSKSLSIDPEAVVISQRKVWDIHDDT